MRLIDADKLKNTLLKYNYTTEHNQIFRYIDEQPTEQHGYNKAIDDIYNALADDLIWIKERFGDDVYTDLWCDVGTRAELLKEGGESD